MGSKKADDQMEFGSCITLYLLGKEDAILSCRWDQIFQGGDPNAEDFTISDLGKCPIDWNTLAGMMILAFER